MKIILFVILLVLNYTNLYSQSVDIIPRPQEVQVGEKYFRISNETSIYCTELSRSSAVILQKYIKENYGCKVELNELNQPQKGAISFKLNKDLGKEEYELFVSEKGVSLIASNPTGWFYGVQSLKQVLPEIKNRKVTPIDVPEVVIKDYPRFKWRAFMLDEARHFKGMDQVKLLLDEMAFLKMNVFHWHLVDDQGWRIEIKKYPLLTQVGSKRKSTQIGPLCWNSPIQSAEPHEGYYTQEEIKEIISYAEERHIIIVPEIEMPGHSSAAIASYPWLGTAKKKIDVPIKFGVGKDVYDVADSKVMKFLTDVLDEVMNLFPSKVIHIGGDEVKYNHWKESASVKAFMEKNELATPADLQVFFTNKISQYLKGKGKRMMGWNEILGHNLHEYQDEADMEITQKLASETIVHFWKGDVSLATHAAIQGYEIVNSIHTDTYLDYSYGYIPLSRAYNFDPIPSSLDSKYHNKIIGLGCQMWGEWIPTNGQMHFMVFPRIAAFAEVGWTNRQNKSFTVFKQALAKIQKHWKRKGIYFAPDSVVELKKD